MELEDFSKAELIDLVKKLRSKKKYGLVWEDDKTREHFEQDIAKSFPYLTEIKNILSQIKNRQPRTI